MDRSLLPWRERCNRLTSASLRGCEGRGNLSMNASNASAFAYNFVCGKMKEWKSELSAEDFDALSAWIESEESLAEKLGYAIWQHPVPCNRSSSSVLRAQSGGIPISKFF